MGLFNRVPKNAFEIDRKHMSDHMIDSATVGVNADNLAKAFEAEGFSLQRGLKSIVCKKPCYIKGLPKGVWNLEVRIESEGSSKSKVTYIIIGGQPAIDYILSIIKKVN